MTSIIQKKPPAPKPVNKADPKPLVKPPVMLPPKPPVMLPPKPPIVRPGPIRADDTGFVPPSERKGTTPAIFGGNMANAAINAATRGGTPATVRDAPGYRGIGAPTMPSSLPLGAKKGGKIVKNKISTATKNKRNSNW